MCRIPCCLFACCNNILCNTREDDKLRRIPLSHRYYTLACMNHETPTTIFLHILWFIHSSTLFYIPWHFLISSRTFLMEKICVPNIQVCPMIFGGHNSGIWRSVIRLNDISFSCCWAEKKKSICVIALTCAFSVGRTYLHTDCAVCLCQCRTELYTLADTF